MAITGKILFSNNQAEIFSGYDIKLIIEIDNQEKVFIKEMSLIFFGEANCKWDDLMGKNEDGEVVYLMQTFKDYLILIDNRTILYNMDMLNKGKYKYNIVLRVPQQLPESLNRKYGGIRYELKLGICSAKGTEILFKMPLIIKRYLNICLLNEYMKPFHTVFKKSFCWGICQTQPMKVIITLPNTCFIPGDTLLYLIKIENFSKLLDLQWISIILTQTQHFRVLKPMERTKQVYTTLKHIKHNFNENHHNSKLHGSFVLPKDLTPISLDTYLVGTSYYLRFILVFTLFQTDGFISVPIKIGSHRIVMPKIGDFAKHETVMEIDYDKVECEA